MHKDLITPRSRFFAKTLEDLKPPKDRTVSDCDKTPEPTITEEDESTWFDYETTIVEYNDDVKTAGTDSTLE